MNYVFAGGSALFISDANFGSSYGDAPTSDQDFLTRFGLAVQQDMGKYSVSRSAGDFRASGHPILAGREMIEAFLRAPATASAREIEHAHQDKIAYVPVNDAFVAINVDTPDEYAALPS